MSADGTSTTVAPGSRASLELDPVTFVRQTTGETRRTRPIIRIRNNGRVTAYGSEAARVFPRHASRRWVQTRIHGYRENPAVETDVAGDAFAAFPPR